MKPDAVVVLAHLMEQDGTLGSETKARSENAAELAVSAGAKLAIMGWNYRPDTRLCISDAIAAYLRANGPLDGVELMIDRASRETVGDAVFSKKMLADYCPNKTITVVTSDYHAARALEIFRFIYGVDWKVEAVGVPTDASPEKAAHEQESLQAFRRTFSGVDSGNDEQIFRALTTHHPFYNGKVYPSLRP